MTVILNPKLQQFVDEQVRSGRFASAEEAVEAGLARLMLDPPTAAPSSDEIAGIKRSLEQMDRGEVTDAAEVHARIKQQIRNR